MKQLCECNKDGFCERFQREMTGRLREICQGVNVDLGTAAAFREQWGREAVSKDSHRSAPPTKLILKNHQAPGDALAMTAAIYSLHKTHLGRYVTAVESMWPEVFAYNPNVSCHFMPDELDQQQLDGWSEVYMHYPAIHQSNERGIHFMDGWCEFLGMALGVPLPLMTNRPQLFFKEGAPPQQEDFWLICSGGKTDFTTKLWGHERYQEVVRLLSGRVKFVQVGSGAHNHPRLDNVIDMVGRTSLRDLFDLVRKARGVLCTTSLLMHVAAALEKPAVIIAGGREPVQWNAYPKQHYLHAVGSLPCRTAAGATGGACWRYRTEKIGDGTIMDDNTCEFPVNGTPKCMTLITPRYVADTILQIEEAQV